MQEIGVISDTHNLLRPEAADALQGCDMIVHAGDIGSPAIIAELEKIAPLVVIRGNIDKWARELPDREIIEVEQRTLYMLHNLNELEIDPVAAGFDVVISGHSHKPKIEEEDGVLYLNPGSAGPRRFTLPIALAKLQVAPNRIEASIVELEVS